jgi:flagellar biosynthesis/type III secretory pathway protein FliH
MSSLAKTGGFIRAAGEHDDVFILGETARRTLPADATLASAGAVMAAAEQRAAEIVAAGEARAAALVAEARASAGAVTTAAYNEGFSAGAAVAEAEAAAALDLIRRAASDGQAIREQLAGQSAALIARAVVLALRRLVGEYYEADPTRTALACADALRAASGQDIIAIRVHSGLVDDVQASLTDVASYVRPDDSIEIGGCIIDLRSGTLDATLDARLTLMELALREAGGEVQL